MAAPRTADVVVVGAGLVGTSVALQLARTGVHVALVERDAVGAGDSGLCFGLVRRHYSNRVTTALALRGVEMIENWAEEIGTGDPGYVGTGYLLTADAARLPALEENVRLLRGWGLATEIVTPEEIAELEPLFSLAGIAGGAYEPDGGFADAQKMVLSLFAAAVRAGAEPLVGTRVERILLDGERVTGVETGTGPISAGAVVLAAGGWARELAVTAGIDLPIELRRVQAALVRQEAGAPLARIAFSDMVSNLVLRPDRAGLALAVAYRPPEPVERRDCCHTGIDPDYAPSVLRTVGERLPAYARAEVVGGFAGAYDSTPDWNPILGWAPGIGGLYLAAGWSGHGFKLAPAVGEVVAAAVLGEEPGIDVADLRPQRFAEGRLLRLAYGPGARA